MRALRVTEWRELATVDAPAAEHSTLCADTGLSEIELDRMGLVGVEREGDPFVPGLPPVSSVTSPLPENLTWPPYKDRPWWTDEDVARCLPRQRRWWGRCDPGEDVMDIHPDGRPP